MFEDNSLFVDEDVEVAFSVSDSETVRFEDLMEDLMSSWEGAMVCGGFAEGSLIEVSVRELDGEVI